MTHRILVVDDDRSILGLVHEILEDAEYEVFSTADPVEGLRLLERESPDLVVLDMRMPVLDGWGFKRELGARGIDTPIVVMTAAQNARRWSEEIGAIGYVAKPFDIDELLHAVQEALPGEPRDSGTASCSIEELMLFHERYVHTAGRLVAVAIALARLRAQLAPVHPLWPPPLRIGGAGAGQ